jgi:CBS domain-containing protein
MSDRGVSGLPEVMTAPWCRSSRGFRRLRRVPVVRDGRLIGILSRGDLVRALAATPPATTSASDEELVRTMRQRMAAEPWTSLGLVVRPRTA